MQQPWITRSSHVKYENAWIRLNEVEFEIESSSSRGIYGIVEPKAQAVSIVAVDSDCRICLIREYRFPVKKFLWRIPMGGAGHETRDPVEAAQAELLEEAGVTARQWKVLAHIQPMSGLSSEEAIVYLATEIEQAENRVDHTSAEPELVKEILWMPVEQVRGLTARGILTDGQALSAIFLATERETWLSK